MHPMVRIALRTARDAGRIIAQRVDRLDRIQVIKDQDGFLLTSLDQEIDALIMEQLRTTYPDHSYQSRVSGRTDGKQSEIEWLIDPIVGNRNLLNGLSHFAISIACRQNGTLSHAVLIDPLLQEEFIASRGDGAQLNSHRIRVAADSGLNQALLGINRLSIDTDSFLAVQRLLLEAGAGLRMTGCSSLDMVYTACGRLAGGWCGTLAPSSRAAADLILREAGGLLGSGTGSPSIQEATELVFGGAKPFRELLKLRARAG